MRQPWNTLLTASASCIFSISIASFTVLVFQIFVIMQKRSSIHVKTRLTFQMSAILTKSTFPFIFYWSATSSWSSHLESIGRGIIFCIDCTWDSQNTDNGCNNVARDHVQGCWLLRRIKKWSNWYVQDTLTSSWYYVIDKTAPLMLLFRPVQISPSKRHGSWHVIVYHTASPYHAEWSACLIIS